MRELQIITLGATPPYSNIEGRRPVANIESGFLGDLEQDARGTREVFETIRLHRGDLTYDATAFG